VCYRVLHRILRGDDLTLDNCVIHNIEYYPHSLTFSLLCLLLLLLLLLLLYSLLL
jgi:hypothetical protein